MGCITPNSDQSNVVYPKNYLQNEGRQRNTEQEIDGKDTKNKLNRMETQASQYITLEEYIGQLFKFIKETKEVTTLLDEQVFIQLEENLKVNYWSQENKKDLNNHVEEYIKFVTYSLCAEIQTDQPEERFENKITSFVQSFSYKLQKVLNQVLMKKQWMLETLSLAQKFYDLQFSLQQSEIKQVSNDVLLLSNKQMLSLSYLSLYLVKCCEAMLKSGKTVDEINNLLREKAQNLKNLFCVKNKRQEEDEIIGREEEEISQKEKFQLNKKFDFINQTKFQFKTIKFRTNNKEDELDQEIKRMIDVAKKNHSLFDSLVYEPSISVEGFRFKSNLKLKNIENKASLLRIKEKLLKNQFKDIIQFHDCKTFKELRKREEENLKKMMKEAYNKLQQIQFTTSDLLRGKCLFNNVKQIYEAADRIIKKINLQKTKGLNIQIVEVDNRLQKITKDLVFKIKIDDLICQFQMVISFKEAQDAIHHKMYELVRSKVLSPISLLFQWNERSLKEYAQTLRNIVIFVPKQKQMQLNEELKKFQNFVGISKSNEMVKKDAYAEKSKIQQLYSNNSKVIMKRKELFLKLRPFHTLLYLSKSRDINKVVNFFNKNINIHEKSLILAKQLNQIGMAYKACEKNEQALDFFNKSLKTHQDIAGENDMACATILKNIGRVYQKMGQYEKALQFYSKSLKIQQAKGKENLNIVKILKNIGSVYRDLGKNEEALQFFNKSLDMQEKAKGKDHIQCARILKHIGMTYKNMGKYHEALDSYNRCLAIKEKIHGKDSVSCAIIHNSIAQLYEIFGKKQEAKHLYKRSHSIKHRNSVQQQQIN